MDAPLSATPDESRSTNGLSRALNWVVHVRSASPHQTSLTRFVAGASALLGVATAVAAAAGMLAQQQGLLMPILLAGAAVVLLAYGLNRSGRYQAAVWLMLAAFMYVPYATLLIAPKDVALAVLCAAITATVVFYVDELLSTKGLSLWVSGVAALLYLSLPLVRPEYTFPDMLLPVAGIVVIGVLNGLRDVLRTRLSSARPAPSIPAFATADDLNQKTVSKLEHELRDLRIELQAAVDEYERVLSEVEEAKEQAERANYVKSAFLASMSHELRTPLNAIINLTKFVVDGDLGPITETQQETLREVFGSGKHLLNLINDVLDMSKIESGSLNLFVEDNIDLKSILQSVVVSGRGLLAGSPVEIELDAADDLPPIRGDRQRITQIVLNIMANACKYTQEGSIKLKAHQQDGNVVISVQDTGPGISPEESLLVYEAFKQTDAGLRHGGGTGLGMPISKNLAEAHGGRLWFESEQGKGATFHVSLPVKSEKLVPLMGAEQEAK